MNTNLVLFSGLEFGGGMYSTRYSDSHPTSQRFRGNTGNLGAKRVHFVVVVVIGSSLSVKLKNNIFLDYALSPTQLMERF